MADRQTFTLLIMVLGFCFLHTVRAASSNFQISARLIQPLVMKIQQENNRIFASITQQQKLLATLTTESGVNDTTKTTVADNAVVVCSSDSCKGDKIHLSDLLLNKTVATNEKNLKLEGFTKLSLNDKPGNYSGDVLVSLAAA